MAPARPEAPVDPIVLRPEEARVEPRSTPSRLEQRSERPSAPSDAYNTDRIQVDVLGPRRGSYVDGEFVPHGADYPGSRPGKAQAAARLLAWVAFTLAVFAFGSIAGFQFAGGRMPPAIIQAPSTPLPPPPDPFAVNLSATLQDGGILVRWNHDAAAVQTANRGVLMVTEQRGSKEVPLGYTELKNGTVIYQQATREVTFRLELHLSGNRQVVETVTWKLPEAP
jgi:hypothetical protein